tara:strand:- start:1273 stop:2610 length:1338 start_codon:yes stop_codon:yes gene_type:complete
MPPNILFITIDSLRADRFYGKNRTCKTPNIDSLISKGMYCKNAVSSSDATGITLGNFFTGKYSFKTGITLRNFNSKATTLFDILKLNGYSLYGLVPRLTWFNYLTKPFDEKKDFFCANMVQDDLSKIGNSIIEKLHSKKMNEPWLYYIHVEDLHEKIILPDDFNHEKYGKTEYDRMVSCVDNWIGLLLKEIDLNNTLLVLTADHGEYIPLVGENVGKIPEVQKIMRKGKNYFPIFEPLGLKLFIMIRDLVKSYRVKKIKKNLSEYELRALKERRGAQTLYDETNRIPILFVGDGIKKSLMIDGLVGSVDIFPTILSILGLKFDKSNLDGQNLSVALTGKEIQNKPLYIESSDSEEFQSGFIVGVRTSDYKYLRSKEDPKKHVSLFDLKHDPNEIHNLFEEKPEIVEMMEQHLSNILDNNNIEQQSEISDEDEERIRQELKKMGYI